MEIYMSQFSRLGSQTQAPADSLSGKAPLSGSNIAVFLLYPHMVEGMMELCWVSYKVTKLI